MRKLALPVCWIVLMLSGCGGGGGGSGSSGGATKTATLVISSQSTNSNDVFNGFALKVKLPASASLKTDNSGVPLTSVVYLSGKLAGSVLYTDGVTYDAALKTLSVNFPSSNSYQLGEFLTVICDVPVAYTPNVSDVTITDSNYFGPGGVELPSITASATFN